ncbi:eukaryotic translation elongation factor 1 epsilon-1-like [Physella acuta]|uniref:eukaryotic translation elongation factor 1 epsilon-1-like n=1 Tax=Physella acuta TaxID=109671 RepID=UPI0027DC501E|nr:eukaryotic translation elongation factor 1 epsilon-1-like [Physella acuta]
MSIFKNKSKMAAPTVEYFNELCKKNLKTSKKAVTLDIGGGKKISGVSCIAKYLQRSLDDFKGLSLEDRMAVEQWLEYNNTIQNSSQDAETQKLILKELNTYLKDKVYFVAQQLTLADILLYHNLHDLIKKLSFQEKEKYINVSRWFNNVQQEKKSRQSLSQLIFLRTPVYDGFSGH